MPKLAWQTKPTGKMELAKMPKMTRQEKPADKMELAKLKGRDKNW